MFGKYNKLSDFSKFFIPIFRVLPIISASDSLISSNLGAAIVSIRLFHVWTTTMGAPASESVRSDANLQPQGTNSGQNTSFFSFFNYPTTFFPAPELSIDKGSSRDPTPKEAQAIATLDKHHSSDIIAWHTLSQSTEPGLNHRDWPGGLSKKDILAISTLRDCSSESLKQWLELCICFKSLPADFCQLTALAANQKISPSAGFSVCRLAATASSRQTRRLLPRSAITPRHPSPVNSVKAHSPNRNNTPYRAGRTFARATTYGTPALVKPANQDHKYWCTVCDNHSFQNSDGWKKHEKEHEIKYVCMLAGIFETTNEGRRCILCGALNQPDSHHSVHNIAPCVEATNRPSFKRRYDMVGHLRDYHAIDDTANGGIIADRWRCQSSKSAWSCGFCIHLSPALQAHLRHIGTEHFEKGQSIKDWKYSNVIRGLLLQPEIKEAWQHLLHSLEIVWPQEIRWNKLKTESLLYRLENDVTGKETPQSLAKAAYESAEFIWNPAYKDTTGSATPRNIVPKPYKIEGLSPPCQDQLIASTEAPVEHQPLSPPPNQAYPSSRVSPNYGARITYATAALNNSPAYLVPTLDQSIGMDPLTSDTGDMDSNQSRTPFSDHRVCRPGPSVYHLWNAYDVTTDPTHSDQEINQYNRNDKADWLTHPQSNVGISSISDTLECPGGTESPLAQALLQKYTLNDRLTMEAYRKRSGEDERSLDANYGQARGEGDEDIQTATGANGYLQDDLYQ